MVQTKGQIVENSSLLFRLHHQRFYPKEFFTEKEYYEGHINPDNGADWNQSAPIDVKPTLKDFEKTVSD